MRGGGPGAGNSTLGCSHFARIAANSSGLRGFDKYSSIPPARQGSRSPVRALAVMTNGRMAGRAFGLTNGPGGLVPIQLGHMTIHQNGIIGNPGEGLDRLLPIGHHVRPVPQPFHQHARQLLIHIVIVGNQNAGGLLPTPYLYRLRGEKWARAGGWCADRNQLSRTLICRLRFWRNRECCL